VLSMHHHTPINGPKSDHPASEDRSYPIYPVLPQSDGAPPPQGSYGYGLRSRTRGRLWWKLRVGLWLVNLLVIAYCVYYLLPWGHHAWTPITASNWCAAATRSRCWVARTRGQPM